MPKKRYVFLALLVAAVAALVFVLVKSAGLWTAFAYHHKQFPEWVTTSNDLADFLDLPPEGPLLHKRWSWLPGGAFINESGQSYNPPTAFTWVLRCECRTSR